MREQNCCEWVEWDEFGNEKYCPHENIKPWDNESDKEKYCKYCLEGQKVDALNSMIFVLTRYVENKGVDLTHI